jgi:hypothetical protein
MKTQPVTWTVLRTTLNSVTAAVRPSDESAVVPNWPARYRAGWKQIQKSPVPAVPSTARFESRRRLEFLTACVMLPLAALLLGLVLLQWTAGIDYTDYISGHQIMRVPR